MIRQHLRNNVVGYLALVVAMSGTSYAAVRLSKGQVDTYHLHNGAVTTKKIDNGTIKAKDLRTGVLGTSRVVARPRFAGLLEAGTIGMTGAWVQAADEVNTFLGDFTFNNPAKAQCGAGVKNATIQVRLAGGGIVLRKDLDPENFPSAGTGTTMPLELPEGRPGVFEPGVATSRSLTVTVNDNCDGPGHFKVTGARVNVVATK